MSVPRSPLLRGGLVVVALVALLAGVAVALLPDDAERRPSALVPRAEAGDPFAFDPDRAEQFVERAARGFSHPLFAKSPGGAVATAERVAEWRDEIERAAQEGDVDPDTLEAMVFLESAGRPEVRAGGTESATGLTQILAGTAVDLLGMRVDVDRSRRLTRRIERAERRGRLERAARLRRERRRVDERYDPAKALAGAVRYLVIAREHFGRDDLALASYHMGMGNLDSVLDAYGAGRDVSYAALYFDSSPLRHAAAWRLLASFGDDSATYLFRVEAAREIMRRWREDPDGLVLEEARMLSKASAEEALRPEDDTPSFARPDDVAAARAAGELVPLPVRALRDVGVRVDPQMGELARHLDRRRSLYRALRPEALGLLVYLARTVRSVSGQEPLVLTSTVRDRRYQRLLLRRNREATTGFSLHTTGYAFDILRDYRSRRHARAMQFALDRLQALGLIAWVREPAAIHITVGPGAEPLTRLLEPSSG